MRTHTTAERSASTATGYSRWPKVEVQNGSGTWKNIGALLGTDYVVSGEWGEDRDQPVSGASFAIARGTGTAKLSPLAVGSLLNVDDGGAYSPLLEKGRAVRAWSATIPSGTVPISTDWREGFTGRIDAVAWDQTPIVVTCSDLGAWLMDTQIKVDGVQYGTSPVGTAVETVAQALVNAAHSGKLTTAQETIYKQSTKTFAVTNWLPGRPKVLDGIRALLLNTTGDDVRFRYDAAHVSRLTIFDPDRTRTTVDAVFGPTEYYGVSAMTTAIADIRNSGELAYTTAAGVAGSVTSPASLLTDPSILNYGERYFELPESDAIVTAGQAQALLDTVVSDLNAGPLEHEYELPLVWFVQLYDRYTMSANQVHYDEDQTGAVMSYRHRFDGLGKARTTMRLSGKVVGAYAEWLRGIRAVRTTAEVYNNVLATVTASDATTVTVRVDATSPAGTPSVTLTGVTGGATLASGPAIGVASASGQVWVFNRGPAGGGFAQAAWAATFAGNVDDSDTVTIPAVGDTSTVYLQARARVIASDATTVTVRLAVANPSPGATATVSYLSTGVAGVTPASGGTVTPVGTFTEAAGTYIDYTITKPAFGTGTGRVTFTATSTGYVPDSDSVDVPPVERDTITPTLAIVPGAETATTKVLSATGANPSGGTGPALYLTMHGTTASAGGTTYADGVRTLISTVGATATFTVARPPFDTVTQSSAFLEAVLPSGATASETVHISNQVKASFGPSIVVTPTEGPTSTSIGYAVTADTLTLTIDGTASAVPGTNPFTVTRPTAGSQAITYVFTATKDTESVQGTAVVRPLDAASDAAPSITAIFPYNADYPGDGGGGFDVSWLSNNLPTGCTFDIAYTITAGNTSGSASGTSIGNTASPVHLTHPLGAAAPSVRMTITAKQDGVVVCTGVCGSTAIAL